MQENFIIGQIQNLEILQEIKKDENLEIFGSFEFNENQKPIFFIKIITPIKEVNLDLIKFTQKLLLINN